MKLTGKELKPYFEAMRRDRTPNYRERIELSPGRFVTCESRGARDFWEGFKRDSEKEKIDFSLRELYENLVPDGRELVESFNPRYAGGTYMEASGAITSNDFSNITGQVIYNALMEDLAPENTVFQELFPTVSTQFSGEKLAGIANLGDVAQTVAENTNYPLAITSQDWIETPTTTKRGVIVPVTKEAIFFDRTGELINKASAVGQALRLNKEKRAIDCLVDENTTAHRYKWRGTSYGSYVDTPWDNLNGTSALVDWTDINEVEQLFAGITDPNTGEPVVVGGATLCCGPAKRMQANYIRNATQVVIHSGGYATSGNLTETVGPNPLRPFEVVSSALFATRVTNANYWFYGDPRRYAKYMENWPITVTQAPAGSHEEFHRDVVMQYKASERGAFAVVQPRMMIKSAATA